MIGLVEWLATVTCAGFLAAWIYDEATRPERYRQRWREWRQGASHREFRRQQLRVARDEYREAPEQHG